AKSPVDRDQSVSIMIWKLIMPVTSDARRRAATDFREHIDRIDIIRGAIPTAPPTVQPPAMMPPICDMINTRRCVPRQKIVALHVAVVSEQVAESVEVEIVRIAKSMGHRLDLRPFGR